MKFNKWTLGLAAVGAVSLASVAQAEEKTSSIMTAVSSTVLSGYVDTSIHWDIGSGNANVPAYKFNTPGKADGFNLDGIVLSLSKPLDESDYAAGYKVDLMFGPDANFLGTSVGGIAATDFAIRQAYVALRTPLGSGIDWKLGVFDNWIGYESIDAGNNPNYTRSYGFTLEPTTFTGLMGTYKFSDLISAAVGIADTTGPIIGGETVNPNGVLGAGSFSTGRANPPKAESYKTYMGSVALTAPSDWSSFAGSMLYAGIVNGWGGGASISGVHTEYYVGATLNTPVKDLKLGASFDFLNTPNQGYAAIGNIPGSYATSLALYSSYQATEKLSLHARAEYFWQTEGTGTGDAGPIAGPSKILALTGTAQYDLWKNVISRLEIRWDHQAGGLTGGGFSGGAYGGALAPTGGLNAGGFTPGTLNNSWLVAANIIYKF